MKLKNLKLRNNIILAPISGVTDYPFRRLARENGCDLTFTWMLSADGLLRKGYSFLKIERDDHPISVQLFGQDQDVLAEASVLAEALGADGIDLNMGCPVKKVVDAGAGVELMRHPKKVRRILERLRQAVRGFLTIKIRSGWDRDSINAIEIARIAEDSGIDGVILHPRTKVQGFRGRADWNMIREVKNNVHIPVIGNGDARNPILVKKMLEETGCDGVMIGRGALGNPWIFNLESPPSDPEERLRMIFHHYLILKNYYGEKRSIKEIIKHIQWYTKGLPYSSFFRSKITKVRDDGELFEILTSYFGKIKEGLKTKDLVKGEIYANCKCW